MAGHPYYAPQNAPTGPETADRPRVPRDTPGRFRPKATETDGLAHQTKVEAPAAASARQPPQPPRVGAARYPGRVLRLASAGELRSPARPGRSGGHDEDGNAEDGNEEDGNEEDGDVSAP